jgi:hypothetical protein
MKDPQRGLLVGGIGTGAPAVLRGDWRTCLPWLVFAGALLTTTGISALTVGLSDGQRWGIAEGRAESLELDVSGIDARLTGSTTYWMVWLVPFSLTLGIGCLLFAANRASCSARGVPPSARCGAARTFLVASALFMVAWAWAASRYGLLSASGIASIVESWSADLHGHYASRVSSFESVDFLSQCMVYQALPALWIYGLLACVHPSHCTSARGWASARFVIMTALYVLLALAAHQKALLANLGVLAAFVCVARFGPKSLGWIMALLVAVSLIVHLMMSSMVPGWTAISTIDHITGRTGDAYPFAVWRGLHQAADGRSVLHWTLGFWVPGVELHMNRTIGDIMFPGVEAFVALAAPTWAFASDGYTGWAIALLLLLVVLGCCGQLWRWRMPWEDREVLGVEGMFIAYFLTQVPFIGLIWWSYSFLAPAAVVLLVRQVTLLAAKFSTVVRHRHTSSNCRLRGKSLP